MFRSLAPLEMDDDAIVALAGEMRDVNASPDDDNPRIPAGYTYLGQFIDHDITFDPMSQLQRRNDPDALVDFRTPRFDLDSLYGSGPADSPFLYEWSDHADRGLKLLAGRRGDLPRNQQGRALIGDPRNDVNLVVSQLHVLFVDFHNVVVDHVRGQQPGLTGGALLQEAQLVVRWHYQWIVVHDFLERLTALTLAGVKRTFFTWRAGPFMPVEFSGAAYRFGHSMVRAGYDLNDDVTGVPTFTASPDPGPLEHLGGFRPLPDGWTVDWSRFFDTTARTPQASRKIDTKLAGPLFRLPSAVDVDRRPLAELNLRRGVALGLPSGQAVAEAMGEEQLPAAEAQNPSPLWFYLLREAQTMAGGEHLGPVGAQIVAEVLVGLLEGDPQSYLSRQPGWRPTLPAAEHGNFTMADLVRFTRG